MYMCVFKFLNYGVINIVLFSYCLVWIIVLFIENFESFLIFVIILLFFKFIWYMLYMFYEVKWLIILYIIE